jgi:hypothetical protein
METQLPDENPCLLFWLVLSHKVPTWENKLSLFWQGPNICPLCKGFLDECDHIFVHFSYIRDMWDLSSYTYNIIFLWQGASIEEAFMDWHNSGTFEEFQALPTIFIHGVWTAQNLAIFQDIYLPTKYMATKGMTLLNSFPQVVEIDRPRHITVEEIDHVGCWSYFDGASQNHVGGAGGILYLDEHHWLKYVVGLGNSSNNKVELLALKMLIMVAGIKEFRISKFLVIQNSS